MVDHHEHRRNRTGVERLEARRLLSAAPVMRAYPAHELVSTTARAVAPAFAAGSNGPVGFTPAQVRSAYGIDSVSFNGTAGDGAAQTIAIVVAYDDPAFVDTGSPGFATSDLHQFDQQLGIADPPSFTKVDQNGSGTSLPGTDPTGGFENETALDVEWAHAAAPAASILLVECYSAGLNDLIAGGVQYARQQPGVSVVSMSFAAPEAASELSYDQYLTTPAGHAGVTFVAAAGDSGAPAEYPAASPSVIGVGGTTVQINAGTYSGETALSNGGGGVSQFEPKPAYQDGLAQSATNRLTPDVAFEANHNTNGNDVYDSYNGGSNPWYSVGGTSFAAPIWAGLIAQADQGRARLGLSSLDAVTQTLPRLYYLNPSDFHDVTTGSNGNPASAGYDLVTGRGTPIANQLVPDLAGGASISGTVFLDNNANGTRDSGESGLLGTHVFLDLYDQGIPGGIDPVVSSDANGGFGIGDLPGGTYRLNTVGITSYHKTTAAYYTITVGYDQTVTNQQIGEHYDTGTISGHIFEDLNLSLAQTGNDPTYGGWPVYLDNNNDGVFDAGDAQTTSDANGYYQFTGLPLGTTYHVRQDIPVGYSRTTLGGGQSANVPLFGTADTLNIGYVPNTASISGTVFRDDNGDAVQDNGEPPLFGWGAYLDLDHNGTYTPGVDIRVFSDASGHFTISGLAPGTYVLNEGVPTGFRRTGVSTAGYAVVVGVGQAVTDKNFGNQPV